MIRPSEYYNQHSHAYVKKWSSLDADPGSPSHCLRRWLMDIVLRMSNFRSGDNIVEVGCGSGLLLREVLKHSDRVFGVDVSREMLNRVADSTLRGRDVLILKSLASIEEDSRNGKVLLAVDDFLNLSLQRGYFDKILSVEVLRYIDDLDRCFANVFGIMKEDSRFVFSITNLWSFSLFPLKFRLRTLLGLIRKDELPQYFMTEGALRRRLRKAGLEIVELERLGFFLASPWVRRFITGLSRTKRIRDLDGILTRLPLVRTLADTFVVCARRAPENGTG